jgi:hypothetical protein
MGYLLNSPIFILFQPAEKELLACMTIHMVIDRGPRQAQNSTSEALKHSDH